MTYSVLSCPRLLIAGLGGGSGKTLVSLGLAQAFSEDGLLVQTFKKGPDYVDAKWLSQATGQESSNLDPFLFPLDVVKSLFWTRCQNKDLALIEGNRGLYDGKDVQGTYSSAQLAKILDCPIIIVADCTKVTRTMAAILLGLQLFDAQVNIQGVILNRTAGPRHQNILRQSIEQHTDLRVLGILPKIKNNPIPERQMGLLSSTEITADPLTNIASLIRQHVDLQNCLDIARQAQTQNHNLQPLFDFPLASTKVRIGIVRDPALSFYYFENLTALEHAGAELIEFSLLHDSSLPPDLHALYLGGGFPELYAHELSQNLTMKQDIARHVHKGLPVYAESGGFTYLSTSLEDGEKVYPMVGIFPLTAKIYARPQGHGYMQSKVDKPNPFYALGTTLQGHEFHYSRCQDCMEESSLVFQVQRGQGIVSGWDGMLTRNCVAGYIHMHALSTPHWAPNFVRAARIFQESQNLGQTCPDIRV